MKCIKNKPTAKKEEEKKHFLLEFDEVLHINWDEILINLIASQLFPNTN